MSGDEGSLGEIRKALAGITRRLDALADAVGVAATPTVPGILLDESTRTHLAGLQSLLAIGRGTTRPETCLLAIDRDPALARCLGRTPRAVLPLSLDDDVIALLAVGGSEECGTQLSERFERAAALALRNARLHAESLRAVAEPSPPTVAADASPAPLAREGYRIDAAADVGEAVALLGRGPVDLVVTDLALPGGSGLEIARTVKRLHPGTPVILITGWPGRVAAETLESHGIDAILEKPVGLDTLRTTIATLIERVPTRPR